MDEFERRRGPGLEPDHYSWTAVLHRELDGGVHAHILAAQCGLETGRSLNIGPRMCPMAVPMVPSHP